MALVVGIASCDSTTTPARCPAPACPMFPADSYWHADGHVAAGARATRRAIVATVGATAGLKADFGSGLWDGGPIGIPYVVVPGTQAKVAVTFDYDDESDPGPYPIPANAPIEGGPTPTATATSSSSTRTPAALRALRRPPDAERRVDRRLGRHLRPAARTPCGPPTWTSADAAGLPILPGPRPLRRGGRRARSTTPSASPCPSAAPAYVWPARHQAGSTTERQHPAHGPVVPAQGRRSTRADFPAVGPPDHRGPEDLRRASSPTTDRPGT